MARVPTRVRLRAAAPADLKLLTAMAIAFNDEDGHPLSRGGRAALKMLCAGTPLGLAYIIEHDGAAVGYLVVGLGFSVEMAGSTDFSTSSTSSRATARRDSGRQRLKS